MTFLIPPLFLSRVSLRRHFPSLQGTFFSRSEVRVRASIAWKSQPLDRSSAMRGSSAKDYSVYEFNKEDEAVESSARLLTKKFGRRRSLPVTKNTFLQTCKLFLHLTNPNPPFTLHKYKTVIRIGVVRMGGRNRGRRVEDWNHKTWMLIFNEITILSPFCCLFFVFGGVERIEVLDREDEVLNARTRGWNVWCGVVLMGWWN